MASDSENRYWTVAVLACVDLVCFFEAGDSFREHQWEAGAIWLLIAVAFSLIGYHWPRIRAIFPTGQVPASVELVQESPAKSDAVDREDWLQLAKDFESCPKQLRGEYTRHGLPGIDAWRISGWSHPDKCRSLASLAGTMLLRSPRVCAELSDQVRSCADPMYRWLYFLKERSHLDNYIALAEPLDDGRTAGVYAGYINNLPEASAAACIECAAKET